MIPQFREEDEYRIYDRCGREIEEDQDQVTKLRIYLRMMSEETGRR